MKVISIVAAMAALANQATAHYIWNTLAIDGTSATGLAAGIRPNTNYNSPVTDLASNDLRCNVGGLNSAGVATRTIRPGSRFTLSLDTAVYHQGPIAVYLTRASSTASASQGDGNWAKIAQLGPTFNGGSATWPMSQSYSFTFPTVPTGEYLLRIEQLAIHNPWPAGIPQFYIACAQLSVTGGSGSFSAALKIPGHVKNTDSGYTANIYNGLTSYTVPGGPVTV